MRDAVCAHCEAPFQAVRPDAEVCSGKCRAARAKARREAEVAREAIHAYLSARAVKAAATRRKRRQTASGQLELKT